MKLTRLACAAFVAFPFGLIGGCGSDDEESGASKCAGVSCMHGTCSATTGSCVCEVGWAGEFCDECATGYGPQGSACLRNACNQDVDCTDSVACNGLEVCSGGSCRSGTPVNCGQGGACNEPDGTCTCSPGFHPVGGICAPNQCDSDSQCDDGLVCNGTETCVGKVCRYGSPTTCNNRGKCLEPSGVCDCDAGYHSENGLCLKNECTLSAECDDGLRCNGTENCVDGACAAGTLVSCGAHASCAEPKATCSCDTGFVDGGNGACVAKLEIVGSYTDAWAYTHDITQTAWTMAASVFRIRQYDNDADFLVAQNGAANQYSPNLWSRFDWTYDGTALYYCQIAFDAADEATAAANTSADRAELTTGCAGFAWSLLTPATN